VVEDEGPGSLRCMDELPIDAATRVLLAEGRFEDPRGGMLTKGGLIL
jgi:hypothetical protein